jgi:D-alanyl-D-alanine carboxypeptidase
VALTISAPLLRQWLRVSPAAGDAARALGPLPACRYDDVLTSPRGYDDWAVTLVDTILRVPKSYVPPDLVSVSTAGVEGNGRVRAVIVDDLRQMAEDADAAGAGIGIQSAYRSYEQQQTVFQGWVDQLGREQALRVSARPGHSEHQLGLALDVRSKSGGSPFEGDWGETKAGKWMAANAWKYGFVMSYPKGKRKVTCYQYESWHFRYVGRDLAAAIHGSGLTIREYLWANYTTAVVPPPSGEPLPTYAPTPEPSASPDSSPSTAPTATPTATPPAPSPSPSAVPTVEPTPVATAEATPAPTAPPILGPIAGIPPEVAATGLGVLAALAGIGLVVLFRRGRSGAVL